MSLTACQELDAKLDAGQRDADNCSLFYFLGDALAALRKEWQKL
jgi:hypothetical protein